MIDERFKEFVPNVRFELIPICDLYANQEYQRALSEVSILRMVEDFDLYQINPVKVSVRDGMNYVFDGQHTIEVVAAKSGSRDTPVWCMIYALLHVIYLKYVQGIGFIQQFRQNANEAEQMLSRLREIVTTAE